MSETNGQEVGQDLGTPPVANLNKYKEEKQLKHQSYVELRKYCDDLAQDLSTAVNMLSEHKQLIDSSHVLMKNYLARQEAMIKLLTKANIFVDSEFEALVDAELGLRLRTADEELAKGDVAWVNYVATIEGTTKKYEDKELPVRVAANAVIFDTELIGKKPGQTFTFIRGLTKGEDAGKNVTYEITVIKAKAKLKKEVANGAGTQPEADAQSSSDSQGQGLGSPVGDASGSVQ